MVFGKPAVEEIRRAETLYQTLARRPKALLTWRQGRLVRRNLLGRIETVAWGLKRQIWLVMGAVSVAGMGALFVSGADAQHLSTWAAVGAMLATMWGAGSSSPAVSWYPRDERSMRLAR